MQHIEIEHPGFFRDLMREADSTWDTIHLDRGQKLPSKLSQYSGVLCMGGPMDVWQKERYPWITDEELFIRKWVLDYRKPFLGVCLGHQLLATALGGEVNKSSTPEVGIHMVSLTKEGKAHGFYDECPSDFLCLQWHGAEVIVPPKYSKVLVKSRDCPVQSLSVGNHAFSFQFHLEITATTVEEWSEVEEYKVALESVLGSNGLEEFRNEAASRLGDFNSLAKRIFENWTKLSLSDRD